MKKKEKTEKTEKTETAKTVTGSAPGLTQAEIQTCLAHAQAIASVLAPYAVTLTTAQRRAQSRYRKEGDTVIPVLARLAKASGLASTALDINTMQQQVELANVLQPLHTTVKTLSDTIGDTVLSAHGDAWNTAVTLHGALVRVSKRNLGLRRDMEAVASAFTRRKKAAAQVAASPTATENAEATTTATAEPSAPAATASAPVTATPSKSA